MLSAGVLWAGVGGGVLEGGRILDEEPDADSEADLGADLDVGADFAETGVVSTAEGRGATAVESDPSLRCQPTGGTICTMLPHFGQATMSPMADSSLTLSRAWQVVH